VSKLCEEPEGLPHMECCVVCKKPTRFWLQPDNIPLCGNCLSEYRRDLSKHCVGSHRLSFDKTEVASMNWLNKTTGTGNTELEDIKAMILCMDKTHPNYSHLSEGEKALVEKLIANEEVVDIAVITLFRWFGSHVGSWSLKQVLKDVGEL
jgi:hypothetical protein